MLTNVFEAGAAGVARVVVDDGGTVDDDGAGTANGVGAVCDELEDDMEKEGADWGTENELEMRA